MPFSFRVSNGRRNVSVATPMSSAVAPTSMPRGGCTYVGSFVQAGIARRSRSFFMASPRGEDERVVDDRAALGRELQALDLALHARLDLGVAERALARLDARGGDLAVGGDAEVDDELAGEAAVAVDRLLVAGLDRALARLDDAVDR